MFIAERATEISDKIMKTIKIIPQTFVKLDRSINNIKLKMLSLNNMHKTNNTKKMLKTKISMLEFLTRTACQHLSYQLVFDLRELFGKTT